MDGDDELTAEIQAQVEEWSANSKDCFTLHIRKGDRNIATFLPEFTYEFFGEEEAIFGYHDLSIDLLFAAHDMRPSLSIHHGKVFPAQSESIRPTDIKAALRGYLPDEALDGRNAKLLREGTGADWTPPGEEIHAYVKDGERYEIRCASLADPEARRVLENMQILVPMFIEGGSVLQLEQDWSTQRWKIFLLYRTDSKPAPNTSPYTLVGFGTSYRVFTLPDRNHPSESEKRLLDDVPLDTLLHQSNQPDQSMTDRQSPLDLPSRERLSQFLILPPFQGNDHGKHLYNTIYTHLTSSPNIREFTVEDPNEAFDDLRDRCDLLRLRSTVPEFLNLRINTDIPADRLLPTEPIPTHLIITPPAPTTLDGIRAQTKLEKRQFDRLVEMHTLSLIPPPHRSRNRITRKEKSKNERDRAYYFWRLYVKERLYVFNREVLVQVERGERVERLEAAVEGVVEGYARMLEKLGRDEMVEGERGEGEVGGGEDDEVGLRAAKGQQKKKKKKRKVIDEEDDGEDEDEEMAVGRANGTAGHGGGGASKRPRQT
ncbi:hypothetical protein BAUCODRAFT_31703 [Baudoinia panamericana UAMH 10762]|uniref:Histone acetyltransferase type B catalytic subunit n=1 Tax=Baudoinia panamericana (strain UAMH 10762) TaxID=717646 RepID=M2NJ14_BAUPA|nr:uncharacterized protein BAUCODRAFT_31703 [Baudoinia panamericana UAMH 10762]EMC99384.1 hypothetical protein BAUCODRAFT_31703 [Baudoinia panamericana UAMH 10762]